VGAALAERQPVISVDTKKKELVGDFKNSGREYRPAGDPKGPGARLPDQGTRPGELYGVYDLAANAGWINLGSTTTQRPSPSRAFAAGGRRSVERAIPMPRDR
jgi:hypothetical protein